MATHVTSEPTESAEPYEAPGSPPTSPPQQEPPSHHAELTSCTCQSMSDAGDTAGLLAARNQSLPLELEAVHSATRLLSRWRWMSAWPRQQELPSRLRAELTHPRSASRLRAEFTHPRLRYLAASSSVVAVVAIAYNASSVPSGDRALMWTSLYAPSILLALVAAAAACCLSSRAFSFVWLAILVVPPLVEAASLLWMRVEMATAAVETRVHLFATQPTPLNVPVMMGIVHALVRRGARWKCGVVVLAHATLLLSFWLVALRLGEALPTSFWTAMIYRSAIRAVAFTVTLTLSLGLLESPLALVASNPSVELITSVSDHSYDRGQ